MPDEKKARGSYSVGVATHEAILNAAMRLIAESGYYGFSLRDVAKIVGISHPAVIYHFPSKEALLTAVIESYEKEIGIIDVSIDPDSGGLVENGIRTESMFQAGFALMRLAKHPDAALIMSLDCMLTVEASSPNHPAHQHYVNCTRLVTEFLIHQIEGFSSSNDSQFLITSEQLAHDLVRNWYGVALRSRYVENQKNNSVEMYLAQSAHSMSLTSDHLIRIAAEVPEDLADVFGRILRLIRLMHV